MYPIVVFFSKPKAVPVVDGKKPFPSQSFRSNSCLNSFFYAEDLMRQATNCGTWNHVKRLPNEWFKENERFVLWVNLIGKEGDKKCNVPKSTKSLNFKQQHVKSKEVDERHASSTFSRGVHWERDFSFIQTHCYQ